MRKGDSLGSGCLELNPPACSSEGLVCAEDEQTVCQSRRRASVAQEGEVCGVDPCVSGAVCALGSWCRPIVAGSQTGLCLSAAAITDAREQDSLTSSSSWAFVCSGFQDSTGDPSCPVPPTTVATPWLQDIVIDPGCMGATEGGCGAFACEPSGSTAICNVVAAAGATAGDQRPGCQGYGGPGMCALSQCDGVGHCVQLPVDARCDDSLSCTIDQCLVGGYCDHFELVDGTCFIQGACFERGDSDPQSQSDRFKCVPDPDANRYDWTYLPGEGCTVD